MEELAASGGDAWARASVGSAGLLLAFVLLMPLGAAAQTVTIEGGAATGGLSSRTVSAEIEGVYVGMSVAVVPDATWLQPHFAVNRFPEFDLNVLQAGLNLRLGPEQWLTRPVARFGTVAATFQGDTESDITFGGGLYFGRNVGALFTVDWGSDQGGSWYFMHLGGYVSF